MGKSKLSRTFVWILMGLLFVGLAGFGATNLSGSARSVASVGDKPSGEAGQLLISRDFGETWAEAKMDTPTNSTIWSIGTHPSDEQLMYCCTIFGQIFKSTDAGSTWTCRHPGSALGQLPDRRPSLGSGLQLCHQLVDLAPRAVGGPLEDRLAILGGQVRCQPSDPAQVEPSVAQHGEEHRVLARGARHRDPQVSLLLAQVEYLGAVLKHRRGRLAGVEPALVELGDVRHDIGLDTSRLPHERGQAAQQLAIRE